MFKLSPVCLCLKTSPREKPLKPWKEFDLNMKMNLLGGNIFIRMVRTKTRFHTEAKGNLEMAWPTTYQKTV